MQQQPRTIIVAHCVLDASTRVAGVADHTGAHPIVCSLVEAGFGLIQLPCPEADTEGALRSPQAIEHYDTPDFRATCRSIALKTREHVEQLRSAGVEVAWVIGIEGSPTCGVTLTNVAAEGLPDGRISVRAPGAGVLMQELRVQLEPIGVGFVGLDHREPDGGTSRVLDAIGARPDAGSN